MTRDDFVPAFPGQRPPFAPGNEAGLETRFRLGNDLTVTHGAYAAPLKLFAEATAELADELRPHLLAYHPSDEVTLQLLALALRRLRLAEAALDSAAPDQLARLEQDMRGWANTSGKLADKLGLNTTARGRLGLDVAQTRRAISMVAEMQPADGGEAA